MRFENEEHYRDYMAAAHQAESQASADAEYAEYLTWLQDVCPMAATLQMVMDAMPHPLNAESAPVMDFLTEWKERILGEAQLKQSQQQAAKQDTQSDNDDLPF